MTDYINYIYELIDLINDFDYSPKNENRMRDLICCLSECNDLNFKALIDSVVFEAAEKLRVFGYIKGQNTVSIDKYATDCLYEIKHQTIQNFYASKVFANNLLDRRQKEIVEHFQNLRNKRLLVSAPTSFGKTFILREILFLNQERYHNILLIFPTIALLNENNENIKKLIQALNLEYHVINNVYSGIDPAEKHIFILTPERALKLLADNIDLSIDFFFFDEVYKIDEDFSTDENTTVSDKQNQAKKDGRAKAFRIVLYLLSKSVPEFYLAGPYLNLNNIKPGLQRYIESNNITSIQIDFEPTMKIEVDAWKKGAVQRHPVLGEKTLDIYDSGNLNTVQKICSIINYIEKNDLGQSIFYCSTPAKSMNYVRQVIENLPKKRGADINSTFINHLKNRYGFYVENGRNTAHYWTLVRALENGYGIHHGKFPKYIQNEILRMFNDGKFSILFCTSTIIEGVNTNAQNIVIVNNGVGGGKMSVFALKNIKGRAGRYYHNYIGRVFYTSKNQREIEESNQLQLNFSTYDSMPIQNVDIDNADIMDLSEQNMATKEKRDSEFDYELLPDGVFAKNRLFERDVQERYLRYLLTEDVFLKFESLIENTNINLFLTEKMMNAILETMEYVNILNKNVDLYYAVVSNYSMNRTQGVIKYHIDKHMKKSISENDPLLSIDKAYISAFDQIRNIVEYEVPRLLCLFEALYARAASIKGYDTSDFNMSAIIRFFELGVVSEFGLSLVEYGFPVDTIYKIEQDIPKLKTLSAKEAIPFLRRKENISKVLKNLDEYELLLFRAAIKSFEK